MAECILGIKCNGVSIKIDTLTIESDQTPYDYICNVTLVNEHNGNGKYDVLIVDKDLVQGFPIGKWRIVKAWINYNWGSSEAKFIMSDKDGCYTNEITASKHKGCVSGFSTDIMSRSIFATAQKIASSYQSAPICNQVMAFEELIGNIMPQSIKDSYQKYRKKEKYYTETADFLNSMGYWATKISTLVEKYKETKELLLKSKDPRAKQLLTKITEDCKTTLCNIFD